MPTSCCRRLPEAPYWYSATPREPTRLAVGGPASDGLTGRRAARARGCPCPGRRGGITTARQIPERVVPGWEPIDSRGEDGAPAGAGVTPVKEVAGVDVSAAASMSKGAGSEELVRPFLKWAGGKRQLVPGLVRYLPARWRTYREPFLGGGALWLALRPRRAVVGDANAELVNCDAIVRDAVEDLVAALARHPNDATHYYAVLGWDRTPAFAARSPMEHAAQPTLRRPVRRRVEAPV